MSSYTPAAWERAMKVREVILQAMAGKYTWLQAADVLGMSPRTLRRWLTLYRKRYTGYNARHFWSTCRREHGLTWSYTLLRGALQLAGLVRKHRPRGRHFRRRDPRPCFGEMLHLGGSRHRWLALRPEEYQHLIVVVDDATRQVLYAQLAEGESSHAIMTALAAVLRAHGLPQALYTDRAGWAAVTRKAGERPEPGRLTQVGRALKRLGIEHILAYSPQARGRSERVNRTLQDRLVNELRVAGVRTVERANRYLCERFLPAYNAEFGRPATDATNVFVPVGEADLDGLLCHEEERIVGKDNTVQLDGVHLQIDKQPGRVTCAGLSVILRRHLDGTHSVLWGKRTLGRYDARGRRLEVADRITPSTQTAA